MALFIVLENNITAMHKLAINPQAATSHSTRSNCTFARPVTFAQHVPSAVTNHPSLATRLDANHHIPTQIQITMLHTLSSKPANLSSRHRQAAPQLRPFCHQIKNSGQNQQPSSVDITSTERRPVAYPLQDKNLHGWPAHIRHKTSQFTRKIDNCFASRRASNYPRKVRQDGIVFDNCFGFYVVIF